VHSEPMNTRSVVRAVDILSLISESREGLSLNEIVEATEIPKTTAYEILQMLHEKSMIQSSEGRQRRYQIGVQAFVIGNRFLQNMDFVAQGRPVIDETSAALNMTVFLAILDGNQIIYLYKKEPEHVPIHTASIGNRGDVYCTSLGKAILSCLPRNQLDPLLDSLEFRRRTSRTIMSREALMRDLEVIQKRGYALDDREVLDFVLCVGAPVYDHRGRAVAGISAAGLYSEDRDIEKEGRILMNAGFRLSGLLGYNSHSVRLAGG